MSVSECVEQRGSKAKQIGSKETHDKMELNYSMAGEFSGLIQKSQELLSLLGPRFVVEHQPVAVAVEVQPVW